MEQTNPDAGQMVEAPRPFYKKWWFWVLIVLIIGAGIWVLMK